MYLVKKCLFFKIIGFVCMKSFLLFCYLHLYSDSEIGYWRLIFGGLEVEMSMHILYVAIMVLPDFLFYYYISGKYIQQLKENYVYIFVREKNMGVWWRKFFCLNFKHIIIYEMLAVIILLFIGINLHKIAEIQVFQFAEMILCQLFRLIIITTICNILLLKFNELIAMYANLTIQALPLFLVGILYDMDGAWKEAITYLPFNWYNYNYLMKLEVNPFIILGLLVVLEIMLYLYSEILFKKYEAI